jgi:PIN domain nuclease of toxin-antitoxin system
MVTYLLDTNAIFFLFAEVPSKIGSVQDVLEAANDGRVFISSVSAWEIGLLAGKQTGLQFGFAADPEGWITSLLFKARLQALPLSVRAAILSSRLPGDFHKDPADRLLVASALDAGATFVTRDTKILGWAQRTGALQVLAC